MPTLIIEQNGSRRAGLLSGRVLIGRRANNTIVIDDRAISRIHAWIGVQCGRYYLADTGSRTGTFVNGDRARGRHLLADGDQIQIGPVQLMYRETSELPDGAEPIDLSPRPARELSNTDGVFMDCACGAPIWVPVSFIGKTGQCRYCGNIITIKLPEAQETSTEDSITVAAAPAAQRAKKPGEVAPRKSDQTCGICQSSIRMSEETTQCPSCGLAFHSECWTENRGCSAYGCPQVGALEPAASSGGSPTVPGASEAGRRQG